MRTPTLPLAILVALVAAVPAQAGQRWTMPVPGGAVAGRFDYDRRAPFARGARRNATIAGRAGDAVVSACTGSVTFAGDLPGGEGVVTVRCGALAATHIGLARISVRRGTRVAAGRRIGALAGSRIRLGARLASDRWGYRDPLRLIALDPVAIGPAPPPRAARRSERRRRSPHPPARSAPPGSRSETDPPPIAWLGLAGAAAALGGSSVRRRWRPSTSRRRSTTSTPRRISGTRTR